MLITPATLQALMTGFKKNFRFQTICFSNGFWQSTAQIIDLIGSFGPFENM